MCQENVASKPLVLIKCKLLLKLHFSYILVKDMKTELQNGRSAEQPLMKAAADLIDHISS